MCHTFPIDPEVEARAAMLFAEIQAALRLHPTIMAAPSDEAPSAGRAQ